MQLSALDIEENSFYTCINKCTTGIFCCIPFSTSLLDEAQVTNSKQKLTKFATHFSLYSLSNIIASIAICEKETKTALLNLDNMLFSSTFQ
jgi:hypothetical protein